MHLAILYQTRIMAFSIKQQNPAPLELIIFESLVNLSQQRHTEQLLTILRGICLCLFYILTYLLYLADNSA
jgi:hypothetical protein